MNKHPAKKILVVDDDPVLLTALHRWLEGDGWEVSVASSHGEALRVLEARPQDLVLTDYQLGCGMTGLDILADIRREGDLVPVILMSGDPLHRLERTALASGACAVFHKPLLIGRLLSACNEHARPCNAVSVPSTRHAGPVQPHARRAQFEDELIMYAQVSSRDAAPKLPIEL